MMRGDIGHSGSFCQGCKLFASLDAVRVAPAYLYVQSVGIPGESWLRPGIQLFGRFGTLRFA